MNLLTWSLSHVHGYEEMHEALIQTRLVTDAGELHALTKDDASEGKDKITCHGVSREALGTFFGPLQKSKSKALFTHNRNERCEYLQLASTTIDEVTQSHHWLLDLPTHLERPGKVP